MKLIIDDYDDSGITMISEGKNPSEKRYYIEGCFAQPIKKNRNGRIYPIDVMKEAISKYSDLVKDKRAIGELNHPSNPTPSAERASHVIEKLEWRGTDVWGRARILEGEYFPMAKIATGLIREGIKFGVSTRGLGSLVEDRALNAKVVQPDYFITAIDLVQEPSGIDCWVNGLHEGAEWIFDASSKSWVIADKILNKYHGMNAKQVSESALEDFRLFLNTL
jgi:hypothetical protein